MNMSNPSAIFYWLANGPKATFTHRLLKPSSHSSNSAKILALMRAWIGLCSVLRPHQHNIGYTGDGFTGQKTQPTVSKY